MGDFEGDYDWGDEAWFWSEYRDDPVLTLRTKEQRAMQDITNTVAKTRMSPEQIITQVQNICSRAGYSPTR